MNTASPGWITKPSFDQGLGQLAACVDAVGEDNGHRTPGHGRSSRAAAARSAA